MTIPFFTGFGNFFKKLWTGCTGKDIQACYTAKTLNSTNIPPAAVIIERGKGFVEGAIRKITQEWANHAALSCGGLDTIEAEGGGMTEDKLDPTTGQGIIYVKQDLTPIQAVSIIAFAKGLKGKPYNYPAIVIDFLVGGDDSSNATDFCSEADVQEYASQNIPISQKKAELTSPGDIGVYLTNQVVNKQNGWIIWDTWGITQADAIKVFV
jgi:hypothetical protein